MLATQSRQKSYAYLKRRDVEFSIGDKVFLKIAPMKVVLRFGKKEKPSPRFTRPFEVLKRVGNVAYKRALYASMSRVHNVFHVLLLRRYVSDSSHVLSYEPLEFNQDLTYKEKPVQIMDRKEKELRNKKISLVKVVWKNFSVEEATWEREDDMKVGYPGLFE